MFSEEERKKIPASWSPFFGIRDQVDQNPMEQQKQSSSTPSSSTAPAPPPPKKKRNLPGTPNPDAEVIALSPKTLMATNRFICEVCNKGFQREQNLQLHRRGHNLPWKLRQKSTKEVKRKVYLCPEPTCVHHDPSRALGDLTGIKKHFCRKHGEKKWKCDKCSKRYAVQSDWKAHSKTCGTREYRCDCGTLFSRRDSFITHRAFCDALAQESARLPTGLTTVGSHLYGPNSMSLNLSHVTSQIPSMQDHTHTSTDLLRLGGGGGGSQFDHLISSSNSSSFRPPQPSSGFYLSNSNQDFHEEPQSHNSLLQNKPFHGLMQLPDLQTNASNSSTSAAASTNLFNLNFFSNSSSTSSLNNKYNTTTNNNNSTTTTTNNNNNNSNNNGGHMLLHDQFGSSNGGGEAATLFAGSLMGDHMGQGGVSSIFNTSVQNESPLPQMSATALLQKAAQMGATTSGNGGGSSLLRGFGSGAPLKPERTLPPPMSFRGGFTGGGGGKLENETQLQDLMNSLANGNSGIFGGGAGGGYGGSGHDNEMGFGMFNPGRLSMEAHQNVSLSNMEEARLHQNHNHLSSMGGSDRLTRDFLGVGSIVRSIGGGGGGGGGGLSQRDHHAIDIGSLDSEMNSASAAARSFTGKNLQ
ncbi:Zinc finger protein MAGPIE [Acorus calamus]|uniref:Protein EARLY HEADING DATE 2 n=1 Tax=Acorus calamus TaxID=4465 RepID=A0AAV9D7Y8_ACOCL|nr:Zinc finger protein MAGPIE [Acorus calamus]